MLPFKEEKCSWSILGNNLQGGREFRDGSEFRIQWGLQGWCVTHASLGRCVPSPGGAWVWHSKSVLMLSSTSVPLIVDMLTVLTLPTTETQTKYSGDAVVLLIVRTLFPDREDWWKWRRWTTYGDVWLLFRDIVILKTQRSRKRFLI